MPQRTYSGLNPLATEAGNRRRPTRANSSNSASLTGNGIGAVFASLANTIRRKASSTFTPPLVSSPVTQSPDFSPSPSIGYSLSPELGRSSSLSSSSFCPPASPADSPESYLRKISSHILPSHIVTFLAGFNSPLYAQTLFLYLANFGFHGLPLDVALRKLLRDVKLPRETQQIDRVMLAFAKRWCEDNPDIIHDVENAYILAFSFMMLHTDAFNKSNKKKMNKSSYVKNTRLDEIPPEVLECFYDNITHTPFIYVGTSYLTGPLTAESGASSSEIPRTTFALNHPSGSTSSFLSFDQNYISRSPASSLRGGSSIVSVPNCKPPPQRVKNGIYSMIDSGSIRQLAVDVEFEIPFDSPYSWSMNDDNISAAIAKAQDRFLRPDMVQIDVGSRNAPLLKNAKVVHSGTLFIKGQRSTSRKWRATRVLLTKSQLLYFPTTSDNSSNNSSIPVCTTSIGLADAIAVYDRKYEKYDFTFKFACSNGRQILLRAESIESMRNWLHTINYCAAMKSDNMTAKDTRREQESRKAHMELQSLLRAARHIAILTPFQNNSRTRLAFSIQPLSYQVKDVRLLLQRLSCYSFISEYRIAAQGDGSRALQFSNISSEPHSSNRSHNSMSHRSMSMTSFATRTDNIVHPTDTNELAAETNETTLNSTKVDLTADLLSNKDSLPELDFANLNFNPEFAVKELSKRSLSEGISESSSTAYKDTMIPKNAQVLEFSEALNELSRKVSLRKAQNPKIDSIKRNPSYLRRTNSLKAQHLQDLRNDAREVQELNSRPSNDLMLQF